MNTATDAAHLSEQVHARRRSRYLKLVLITLFLTFDLIVFGGFVRLSDSGLGCPDWPGCYSKLSPIGAMKEIKAAQAVLPHGPVTPFKAWVEMLHRYAGTLIGMMIIGITALAWRWRTSLPASPWFATFTLAAICLQGAFGAWTVTMKLMPAIVTAHLLGGVTILALLVGHAVRLRDSQLHANTAQQVGQRGRLWIAVGVVLLYILVALGGWVSTNYAALACQDFPKCNGQWLPPMDFSNAYTINRDLGREADGDMLTQQALTAIHWVHRNVALLVTVYLLALGFYLRRFAGLRKPATLIMVVVSIQVATGLTNVLMAWPLPVAVMHNAGAAALIGLISWCAALAFRRVDPPTLRTVSAGAPG